MPSSLRSSRARGLAAAALLLAAAAAGAQPRHPAPIPFPEASWGATSDSVVATARRAGLEFLTIDGDGDYAFRGVVAGTPALVFASFGDSGLTRVTISVDPHPSVASTFERMRDSVVARFGRPTLTTDADGPWRPNASLFVATAWRGILMGLRRDGRILLVVMCPSVSPRLPTIGGLPVT